MINTKPNDNFNSQKKLSAAAFADKAKTLNKFVLVLLPIFVFTTVYSIYYNFPRIVYTNGVYIILIAAVWVLNKKGRFSFAKTLFICTNALALLTYHKLMDNETSMFFYFFPLLLCLLLFYRPNEEKGFLYFTVIFLTTVILLTIYLPSSYFEPWPLSADIHRFVSRINSILCTILLAIYTYSIFRKELRLVAEKDAAELGAKAKAIFLSTMSHELRTPLNGIVGTANLIKEGKPEDVSQQIDLIKNLSEHLLSLVNDVLDYSKIESGQLKLYQNTFNLNELVLKLFNSFSYQFKGKNLGYELNIDDRLKKINVLSDDLRLQQILYNLLSNALKFTTTGSVRLNATAIAIDEDFASIMFEVIDTGIGIEANKIDSIFESFSQVDSATTRKFGGTGLGLTISNNLAKLFNANILVKSTLGKGSNFHFTINFPISKEIVSTNKVIASNDTRLKEKKILLVEDNPVNMMVARMMLKKWGVIVTEAVNGKIAVEKCKEQQFDLLLLDLEMPVMDGKTALQEINKLSTKAPAIAFTAGFYENMEADLLDRGFVGYALKPFKPEDLYDKIAAVLG